jgi:putative ABC transport system permease protein
MMGAVTATVAADIGRRRLQSAVLASVLLLASAAATFALNVLVASDDPFRQAFERARGAHLVVEYHATLDEAEIERTTSTGVVTASAGPWPLARAALMGPDGSILDRQTVSGRPQPDDSIDSVEMSAGRWVQRRGEIVIEPLTADVLGIGIGSTVVIHPAGGVPGANPRAPIDKPSEPQVRGTGVVVSVTGLATSVSTPETVAWMDPSDLAAMTDDQPTAQQVLYRVEPSASAADLAVALEQITGNLGAESVVDSRTWLDARREVNDTASLYVPILLAFAAFALAAAAFAIANVVSGIVLTRYRDIGVMKAIGFTPTEVTSIVVGQVLVPVLIGAVAGTLIGVIVSAPTVERMTRSFGLPASFAVALPVVIAVPVVGTGVSLLAAIGPAVRAGRLNAVAAITRGAGPPGGRASGRLRRLGLRVPAGLAARLGLAAGAAHPIRAAMTTGALVVGVAAATFAVGVNLSLVRAVAQLDRTAASPVRAELVDRSASPDAITAMIVAREDTARSVGVGQIDAAAARLGELDVVGYAGDASWIGYELIRGRWFSEPGEVVAPTPVFTQGGLRLGDSLTIEGPAGSVEVRLVGETFEVADGEAVNLVVRGDWAVLTALDGLARPDRWEVQPHPGVSPAAYARALRADAAGALEVFTIDDSSSDEEFLLFLSVVTTMGIVLVALAMGAVFNTVVLETRQRARETAILRTIGLAPAQVMTMVIVTVVPLGILAGLLGVPLGLGLQRVALSIMGEIAGMTGVPDSTYDVVAPAVLVALASAGLAIGLVGAFVPAQRAARARIAPVLQAE